MLSLKTRSRLKTVLRQVFSGLVLVLKVDVLVLVLTVLLYCLCVGIIKCEALGQSVCCFTDAANFQWPAPPLQLNWFSRSHPGELCHCNHMDDFHHKQPNMFSAIEHRVLNPMFCRLLCVPAASAPVERVFSGRPHHEAKRSQVVPEWETPYLKCWYTCVVVATEWLNWMLINVLKNQITDSVDWCTAVHYNCYIIINFEYVCFIVCWWNIHSSFK